MIGYSLTIEQKESIQEIAYTEYQFFNCVQDENDIWFTFLTDDDKRLIIGTEFEWIIKLEEKEYKPKINKNGIIS